MVERRKTTFLTDRVSCEDYFLSVRRESVLSLGDECSRLQLCALSRQQLQFSSEKNDSAVEALAR